MVLDLDETLIHSHHDGLSRVVTVKPTGPPDYIIRVEIEKHPVRFFVYKRPHVDYFLETVRHFSIKGFRMRDLRSSTSSFPFCHFDVIRLSPNRFTQTEFFAYVETWCIQQKVLEAFYFEKLQVKRIAPCRIIETFNAVFHLLTQCNVFL